MSDLKQFLTAAQIENLNDHMKRAYESGEFSPDHALAESLNGRVKLASIRVDQMVTIQAAIQKILSAAKSRATADGQDNIYHLTLWGLLSALVFEVISVARLSEADIIAAVKAAAEPVAQYTKGQSERFAAGQFDAELEARKISHIHDHLEGGSSQPTAVFHVPADGRVH